ncbi:MAG: helix-turn-helix transcriptional regulator [Succinivibrio sp.]|nr:helix-turn-helix transcriptional regulator [Succinivibrio sp.]
MAFKNFSESKLLISKLNTYLDELPKDEEQIEALFYKIARYNLKAFGEKLQQARITSGYSQLGMANSLHVRQATFSDWEHGKNLPRIAYLKQLIEVYQIDPADLIEVNPQKIVNDSLVPLVDSSFFISKSLEVFIHDLCFLTDVPKIPVSYSDKLSFAFRVTDSSMMGGNKPILEDSILLCSTNGLSGKTTKEQALYCDKKLCLVSVCSHEPVVRLITYDNGVLSLTALNSKWNSYSFPDDVKNELFLNNIDECMFNGVKTYSTSVQIFGIVKKMYVDF